MMPACAAMAREHVEQLPLQRRAREHPIDQVRPVERSDELDGIRKAKLRGDIPAHARRRRGGIGVQADPRQRLAQPSQLPVFGTEIVPPLADAVRLVDGDERHAAA